jgi:hypothetical protein
MLRAISRSQEDESTGQARPFTACTEMNVLVGAVPMNADRGGSWEGLFSTESAYIAAGTETMPQSNGKSGT